jgi:hypothetical protein
MKAPLRIGPFALVAVVAMSGCSDLGEPIHLSPHAELSATSLDFGTVAVSSTVTRSGHRRQLGRQRPPRHRERGV